jgi:hypothetical protein
MKCIWCREREIAQDIFCDQCFNDLETWGRTRIGNTYRAGCMRLARAVEELKQAVKASLPGWVRRLI